MITVSSREANSITGELTTVIDLLRNVVGFLFSIYAVRHRKNLAKEGEAVPPRSRSLRGFTLTSDGEDRITFIAQVTGLRRQIASSFERNFSCNGTHKQVGTTLRYSTLSSSESAQEAAASP